MKQFPGDRSKSIYDSVNEGKHLVPKDTEYIPTSKRRKVMWITIGILVALFMIVTGIQVLPGLFS